MSDENIVTPSTDATSLSWMPIFVDDLLALSATLTPAQLGGLMRLRAYAWRQSPPATLPDSDSRLATISGLSASWAEDGPAIREHLVPLGDTPEGKRLLDPWLDAIYTKQLARYISAATRGGKGGRPRKGEAKGQHPEKLGESSAFSTVQDAVTGKSPAKAQLNPSDSSASPELTISLSSELKSSSLNQNTEETKAGGKLSFPDRRPPTDPYRAADESVNSEAAQRDAVARALGDQYQADLDAEIERFRATSPAAYEEHRIQAIKVLGLFGRDLSPERQASVDAETAERIRKSQGWPSKATYMANYGRPAPTKAQTRERVTA